MRVAAGAIVALLLATLIFHAGVVVGSHRGQWGRHDADRGFRSPFLPGGFEMPHGFIQNGHGAVGTISALSLPTFTMQTREGTDQTILVGTSTIIRAMGTSSASSLSVGNKIVVLGEPDAQGRIDAKLIRVLPASQLTP